MVLFRGVFRSERRSPLAPPLGEKPRGARLRGCRTVSRNGLLETATRYHPTSGTLPDLAFLATLSRGEGKGALNSNFPGRLNKNPGAFFPFQIFEILAFLRCIRYNGTIPKLGECAFAFLSKTDYRTHKKLRRDVYGRQNIPRRRPSGGDEGAFL